MITIAIATPVSPEYSETFIKKHFDKLPYKIIKLNSIVNRGYFPIYVNDSTALFSSNIVINYLEYLFDKLFKTSFKLRSKTLKKIIDKEQVKVILAEYGPTAVALLPFCKANDIKLFVHFHGYDAYKRNTLKKFEKGYKALFHYCSGIFSVSTDMTNQLIKLGANANKIIQNPYGVNLVRFSFREPINVVPNTFVFVGRFTQKKAPLLLIKAFNNVLRRVSSAKLIMLGDGELLKESKQLVKDFGIENNVKFLGRVAFEEIPQILSKYEIYVQHSVVSKAGDSEGTPNSILEAMAIGLPIVSTRHAGIKDAVAEGENGYLVEEQDWKTMAERMYNLMVDKEKINQFSINSRKRIEQFYKEQMHLAKITEAIDSAIS